MPLTEKQEKRLVDWCNARGITARCPMCGRNDWTAGEVLAATPVGGGEPSRFAEAAAMVQIVCDHCKAVVLFAASPILGDPS